MYRYSTVVLLIFVALVATGSNAFTSRLPAAHVTTTNQNAYEVSLKDGQSFQTKLFSSPPDQEPFILGESDQGIVGAVGSFAALVTLISEYTLKTTGCGLPAGPGGLFGFTEGISYLSVIAIAGASLYRKVKTGSGLPAGPAGLLGAAEGLSFLAIFVGLIVLVFQIIDYQYIPNAIPMEGGMCQ